MAKTVRFSDPCFYYTTDLSVDNTAFTPVDAYADGANIRKVANGFVVTAKGSDSKADTHVFADAAEMATWIRKRYAVKAK